MKPRYKLIQPPNWYIFRAIRIEGGEYRRFNGFISYKRPFKHDLTPDTFDIALLVDIKKTFHKSEFHIGEHIYYEGQVDDLVRRIKLSEPSTLTVTLMPAITVEEFQKLNLQYLPTSEVYVEFMGASNNDEVYTKMVKDYFTCRVPYQTLEKISNEVYL